MLTSTPDGDDDERAGVSLHDITSARLMLREPTANDVDELFLMYSHPLVWHDDPPVRHTSTAQTHAVVERWVTGWRRHGLGLWVLRALDDACAGQLIGIGGCNLPSMVAWNLAFTLRPAFWGQGYAQEVAAAGIQCAKALRPELPITAVVAERNTRSHRVVERVGLRGVWRGPDTKDLDPTTALLLYSDRALSQEQIRALTV